MKKTRTSSPLLKKLKVSGEDGSNFKPYISLAQNKISVSERGSWNESKRHGQKLWCPIQNWLVKLTLKSLKLIEPKSMKN